MDEIQKKIEKEKYGKLKLNRANTLNSLLLFERSPKGRKRKEG